VRFGRALGKGARAAATSLAEAADAATSPDPHSSGSRPNLREAAAHAAEAHRTVTEAKAQVRRAAVHAGKEAGKGMLAPVKKFSSVLWLEVTGFFFAIFALTLGRAVWATRATFAAGASPEAQHKAWMYAALFLLFVYFSVSSFVRARRRERR